MATELYRPGDSARYVEEKSKSEPWRDEFRRDFARVIHCPSFRRLNVEPDADHPQLRKITVDLPIKKKIEVLKHFTYVATIRSNRVAVSEFRGKDIIKDIFKALDQKKGYLLLPSDYRDLFDAAKANDCKRKRVICDFIAGMTDRYAVEFWGRLYSDKGTTFFKPL